MSTSLLHGNSSAADSPAENSLNHEHAAGQSDARQSDSDLDLMQMQRDIFLMHRNRSLGLPDGVDTSRFRFRTNLKLQAEVHSRMMADKAEADRVRAEEQRIREEKQREFLEASMTESQIRRARMLREENARVLKEILDEEDRKYEEERRKLLEDSDARPAEVADARSAPN